MVIFSARAQEDGTLEDKVAQMLDCADPAFVWVDDSGEQYRFWGVYPMVAADGIIMQDVILPLGDYEVVLRRGCRLSEVSASGLAGAGGWLVEGEIAFAYPGVSFDVARVRVTPDGALHFPIILRKLSSLGAGIRYIASFYEEETESTVFRSFYSPVFFFEEPSAWDVTFFPARIDVNRWEAVRDTRTLTAFQTNRLKQIRLCLPKGFTFRLAAGADRNGYEEAYFTPSGAAKVLDGANLMPGLSGTEQIVLGRRIVFCAGGRAYFDERPMKAAPTTAYLSFPDGVYYSQPQHSSYYGMDAEDVPGGGGVHRHVLLPGTRTGEAEVPLLPFGGMEGGAQEAVRLETCFISRLRRRAVEEQIPGMRSAGESPSYAITRNGMVAAYTDVGMLWIQTVPLAEAFPGIGYTYMDTRFWFSLLSPELFLAAVDLGERAQTPYSVTRRRLDNARSDGYGDAGKLEGLCGKVFLSAAELREAVVARGAAWDLRLQRACSHFNQELGGWAFECAPYAWRGNRMLAILKLTQGRSVEECMRDPALWSLELDDEEGACAQSRFREVLSVAGDLGDCVGEALGRMVSDRAFRGSIFFRAGVCLSGLPEELSFLAAGIDAEKFHACFVAYPFVSTSVREKPYGDALIVYENNESLNFERYQEFGFQVRRLTLDIRDGSVFEFRARVELLVNQLFGIATSGALGGEGGCGIVFDGSYQQDEKGGYYAFALDAPAEFVMQDDALLRVRIESASLRTDGARSSFVLGGALKLTGACEVDLLSFEWLAFEGLEIEMTASADGYRFCTDLTNLTLHPEKGGLREGSFGASFPAKLSGLLRADGRRADDLGYMTLKMKGYGDEEKLGRKWLGLLWRIETGNLGGLAAASRLTLELLTAFATEGEERTQPPCFYCGIRIESLMKTDTFALPLQGMMSLGFDAIELKKDGDFYFRFRNFSLTILGKRFPDTNNDLYLIGDADGNLGWYAAVEG